MWLFPWMLQLRDWSDLVRPESRRHRGEHPETPGGGGRESSWWSHTTQPVWDTQGEDVAVWVLYSHYRKNFEPLGDLKISNEQQQHLGFGANSSQNWISVWFLSFILVTISVSSSSFIKPDISTVTALSLLNWETCLGFILLFVFFNTFI